MLLSEKLNFLMELTSTTNKHLAMAIHVDPSLISRFRSGQRKIPQNHPYLVQMSDYFSRLVKTDYQQAVLAETLGNKRLKLSMTPETLGEMICDWLSGSPDKLGHHFYQYNLKEASLTLTPGTYPPIVSQKRSPADSFSFFKNEGKRNAVRAMLEYLIAQPTPCTIYMASDENMDWLIESTSFYYELQQTTLLLAQRGFKICRIIPPLYNLNSAMECFHHWAALFATENVINYYYPKLRDDLHRRTLVVVPNHIGLVSNSIGSASEGHITLLTYEPRITDALADEFNDHLNQCIPLLLPYDPDSSTNHFLHGLRDFWQSSGTKILKGPSLSAITTPPELLTTPDPFGNVAADNEELVLLQQVQAQFARQLQCDPYTEILTPCSAAQLERGDVPIMASYLYRETPLFYSVRTYVAHLKQILRLLEQYEQYRIVFSDQPSLGPYMLSTCENHQALLWRIKPQFTLYRIQEQHSVGVCRQYLEGFANTANSVRMNRNLAIDRLRDLIAQLEAHKPSFAK